MTTRTTAKPTRTTARPSRPSQRSRSSKRRPRSSARVRRRRIGCGAAVLLAAVAGIWLAARLWERIGIEMPAIETGPDAIAAVDQPEAVGWPDEQPARGVDVSFPQCGRTLRDMEFGFVIVGLDGGMPNRPNPCFAAQWAFAQRQAGAAVYVNTADSGRGDPVKIGRKAGKGDVAALAEHGIDPGTPVWLDVELPEVWTGTQARHRAVISEHLRVLAEAGYPVGVYSAPALWREITGDARLDVPIWVGIGRSSAERAAAVCDKKVFGGREPDVVQRIGEGSDGRPLDRNLVCKGVDLAGLVRPR